MDKYYVYRNRESGELEARGNKMVNFPECYVQVFDSKELADLDISPEVDERAETRRVRKLEEQANVAPRSTVVYGMKFAEAQRYLVELEAADPDTYVYLFTEAEDDGITPLDHAMAIINAERNNSSAEERLRRTQNRERRLALENEN